MDTNERAAQIWSVLALAAMNRQVLNYTIVGQLIGVPPFALGSLLEPIQSYCLVNRLPPLTILVVSQDSGVPGAGFIAAQDIPRYQASVFAFDWRAHRAPTPEELGKAVSAMPSNGIAQTTPPVSVSQ